MENKISFLNNDGRTTLFIEECPWSDGFVISMESEKNEVDNYKYIQFELRPELAASLSFWLSTKLNEIKYSSINR